MTGSILSVVNELPKSEQATCKTAIISGSFLLRSGLRRILEGTSFALVEERSDVAPDGLRHLAAEVALFIVDASQPADWVFETVRQIREQCPKARIVALAEQFDLGFLRMGYEAGVNGFSLTAREPEILIKSLELVMLGETFVPSTALRMAMEQSHQNHERPHRTGPALDVPLPGTKIGKLSNREAEILDCLRGGAPNKVIARQLDVTEATVKVHVKSILRKIGAANRTQAAMWANENLRYRDRAHLGE